MPVSNVFGVSSKSSANAGPATVSGSLQAGFGPSTSGGSSGGSAIRSPFGGALVFSTLCLVGLVVYYCSLP